MYSEYHLKTMDQEYIVDHLSTLADKNRLEKMKRFGIDTSNALGIPVYELRTFAKKIGKNHKLALTLWQTKIHEVRMLAALIDIPEKVTEDQMDEWVKDFNSWDLCDHCCYNLFDKTNFSRRKIREWSRRNEEFVKRAAFSLIAGVASHDKKASNESFEEFFSIIVRESADDRKYVKKAVNWALRNIGKRNQILNEKAIETAEQMKKKKNKTSLWIAKDAIKELTSEKISERLIKKTRKKEL
jgi:3-methyladenine DNA glycosylase AlkD